MLVLSISIIPLIIAQLKISSSSPLVGPLLWADLVVWGLFAAEFIIRLYLAPAPRRPFVRRNWLDLLLVLIPPTLAVNVVGNFAGGSALRSVRAIRVIRVLRAGRALILLARGVRASRRSLVKHPIAWVLLVAAFVTVGAGIVVQMIEANRGVPQSRIDSLPDAFWWAIYNLSTLGSNDFRATTTWGRGLEIVLALLGLGLFGLLAGSLGAFFVDKDDKRDDEVILGRLRGIEAELAKLAPASGVPAGAPVDEPQDSE